jgi:hypothetical protein
MAGCTRYALRSQLSAPLADISKAQRTMPAKCTRYALCSPLSALRSPLGRFLAQHYKTPPPLLKTGESRGSCGRCFRASRPSGRWPRTRPCWCSSRSPLPSSAPPCGWRGGRARLALRQQAQMRDLGRREQRRRSVRARRHAGAAADAGGRVHGAVGVLLLDRDGVAIHAQPVFTLT